MTTFLNISTSLDGYVAGPGAGLDEPLGVGGERIHDWLMAAGAWRAAHGREGGEAGQDDEVVKADLARTGALIMGRKMYSSGSGPWEDDPKAGGWWGEEPPFDVPVFVLTSHERDPYLCFTFVTGGIEAALEQAREAAGDRDVQIAGGANVAQEFLAAGLLDEMRLHVAPLLLGDGVRLFEPTAGGPPPAYEIADVIASPIVTHLTYRKAGS